MFAIYIVWLLLKHFFVKKRFLKLYSILLLEIDLDHNLSFGAVFIVAYNGYKSDIYTYIKLPFLVCRQCIPENQRIDRAHGKIFS